MPNQPEQKDASDRITDPDSIEMKLWRIKVDLWRKKEKEKELEYRNRKAFFLGIMERVHRGHKNS